MSAWVRVAVAYLRHHHREVTEPALVDRIAVRGLDQPLWATRVVER